MPSDVEMEFVEDQKISRTVRAEKKLSKSSKRNLKKKAAREAKRALKASKPSKSSLLALPSSIVIPENSAEQNLDGEALLAEIKRRTYDKNSRSVRIMPIPKNCPPLLLQDLCPTSIAVRIPAKRNSRYAFVEFKTASEARVMANEVNGKFFDRKPIKAFVCEEKPADSNWKSIRDRTLEDFDLTSLYISNLPRFTERTDLAQIFRTADKINLKNLPDGTCKGFCILSYRDRKRALEAFTSRHGTLYRGVPIFVNFLIKPKTKIINGQKFEPAVENVEKSSRKRKASKNNEEEAKSDEVSLPNKKRRLEKKNVEFANESGNDGENVPAVKKPRKAKRAKLREDAEFSIHSKPESGSKKAKLQPYQLARKREFKRSKKTKSTNK